MEAGAKLIQFEGFPVLPAGNGYIAFTGLVESAWIQHLDSCAAAR